jgi:hypothetical protein
VLIIHHCTYALPGDTYGCVANTARTTTRTTTNDWGTTYMSLTDVMGHIRGIDVNLINIKGVCTENK